MFGDLILFCDYFSPARFLNEKANNYISAARFWINRGTTGHGDERQSTMKHCRPAEHVDTSIDSAHGHFKRELQFGWWNSRV